jgi:hypothetical protein
VKISNIFFLIVVVWFGTAVSLVVAMEGRKITEAMVLAMSVAFLAAVVVPSEATSYSIGVCIRNCAQCKKMFGPYFEGQLCADACVKFKGKIIPDCEDIASIAPFLNKFE